MFTIKYWWYRYFPIRISEVEDFRKRILAQKARARLGFVVFQTEYRQEVDLWGEKKGFRQWVDVRANFSDGKTILFRRPLGELTTNLSDPSIFVLANSLKNDLSDVFLGVDQTILDEEGNRVPPEYLVAINKSKAGQWYI